MAYVVPSSVLGVRASLATLRLFLHQFVSVAINAGLNLWLIPRHGLEGAALATLLSWVWRLGWAAWLARGLPAARAVAAAAV
jgi:O-antigen/teichoic acid export membrane protein